MLTVRNTERDKGSALDAGADDYVVKPFSIEELLAAHTRPRCAGTLQATRWRHLYRRI